MASTSHDVVSEIQQLEGCLLNEPIPELQPPEQLAELEECLQLLMWCLDFNPETRPTFEHLARHDWFTGGSSGQSPDAS
ncbi:hypothetical protein KOW79_022362 [Hemibagrus wyckioides]|uniref:Uncharacterized protein n=1 Tax=Hemibagrus wyckioides TaxID=337641 RepID=A0A9D3S7A8_9TELE|nr:hypothetical protein KOW79_022362 [Hemibagrus wyckioides]